MASAPKRRNSLIEFRRDPVSHEWVLISTKIQKKPVFFTKTKTKPLPKSKCPFENPQKAGHKEILFWLPSKNKFGFKNWWVQVLKNKYPVVTHHKICFPVSKNGLLEHENGNGFQELLIIRDHNKPFAFMTTDEIKIILDAYENRYQTLRTESCVAYVLIIHNSGSAAGATVPHPHSQIFAIPIIPPDLNRSLEGSKKYFHENKRCVHCDILKMEIKNKKRVIYKNNSFVALAPYAPKVAYEVRIFPLLHKSRFEIINNEEKFDLADVLRFVFRQIYKKLANPDYNFFIHTAPPKDPHSDHYHWHAEILPRVSVWGGLELGSGIEVIKVSPEATAGILKK